MNFEDRKNYYEVLEVSISATHQDIQNAYQRARTAYSGDSAALYSLMTQDECDRILGQIEDAFSILGVPEKRREYDKAKGFNQSHTPQGYYEKIQSKPDYKPQNSLSELLRKTKDPDHDKYIEQKALREEFTYQEHNSQKAETNLSKVHAYKKFHLDYEPNPEFDQEIDNATEFTGEFLRRIREYKNVSIERMAEMTKVSKTYIRNIEGAEYDKLPAEVYSRGFVYQYAKCLKLNPNLVATSYINQMKQVKSAISNA